ncbi:hypothetical protein CR532_04820 (plasmid) [Candidatus Borreliella tachyglossi]|uniref:Lipoprotein n=1 Tax=Candidatus Borreliella tachyglossi TaxID=1964448 RepID=A0A2S1LYE1_9SPIR|nr:hypothetical protein [Candidatus Borreliella tachyglossi]AWG43323.1 hypothetical protein CR532_04820 [Candidatus Borreliella tachyglossi]
MHINLTKILISLLIILIVACKPTTITNELDYELDDLARQRELASKENKQREEQAQKQKEQQEELASKENKQIEEQAQKSKEQKEKQEMRDKELREELARRHREQQEEQEKREKIQQREKEILDSKLKNHKTYPLYSNITIFMGNLLKDTQKKIKIVAGKLNSITIFANRHEMRKRGIGHIDYLIKSNAFEELFNLGGITYTLNFTDRYNNTFMLTANPQAQGFQMLYSSIKSGDKRLTVISDKNYYAFRVIPKTDDLAIDLDEVYHQEDLLNFNRFEVKGSNIELSNTNFDNRDYYFSISYDIIALLEKLFNFQVLKKFIGH